jgi:hypothetical protein
MQESRFHHACRIHSPFSAMCICLWLKIHNPKRHELLLGGMDLRLNHQDAPDK